MAISNLRLNVTTNTARALADFNKFSRSLDNKFLMSGLKLDVITSALDRINRDFQRAIGEQGLASASSLRAAQNQAALLTQTFKGFASDSALAIQEQIGTALNRVAVTAGGTMKDVQKTLAATPFISTRLGEDMRDQLNKGIFAFQRDVRRAGLGENFGAIAQQFLMGRASGMDLVQTGNPLESFIGAEIIKRSGGQGEIPDALERSRVFFEVITDKRIQDMLQDMAKRAMGFRLILEDINTKLFNPEFGVFGSLKKVVDSAGKTTTMFDEVENLTKQVFGEDGMFAALSKTLKEVFGAGFDPMRPFIDAVQFVTGVFKDITGYFNSSEFAEIASVIRDTFGRVGEVFKSIYDQIRGGTFNASEITDVLGDIGGRMREYIQAVGKSIRGEDVGKESQFAGDVLGTVVEEVGKTTVVLIKELLMTLINKVPEIATAVLPEINKGINAMMTEIFGNELAGKIVKFILGFVPGTVGQIARASTAGDLTGGGGNILSMLAMGAAAVAGPGAVLGMGKGLARFGFGAARLGVGLFGPNEARMDLLNRVSGIEDVYNRRMRRLYLPGAQRAPLSGFLSRFIAPREKRPRTLAEAGIGLPETDRAREARERREALMSGRITAQTSMFARNIRPAPQERRVRPFINPLGMIISPETSMFEAIPGFFEQERTRRESAVRGNRERSAREGMERYRRSLASYRAETSAFRFYNVPEYLTRDPIDYTGFDRPIGPQPHGANWAYAPEYGGIGGDYAPFMESSYTSPREREVRRRLDVNERYKRMYESGSLSRMGRRSRISSIASRFRPGKRMALGLGAAGIVTAMTLLGGPGAKAQTQFDPATGQMVPVQGGGGIDFSGAESVLSGGFEGATIGATIGSVIPGIGTAAGAVIGGIIGGIAPLMDKGVKQSFEKMLSDLGTRFGEIAEWFSEGTRSNFEKLGNMLGTLIKGLGNALVFSINASLTAFTLLPRLIIGTVESLFNMLPDNLKPAWAKSVIGGISSVANFQLPYFFGGKDYYGPSMALEAQMSGRRPMVVNDGEFVIPKDGFPTLAGLVANNLRSTNTLREPPNNTQVNITLAITTNSVVADASELANTLREPVYQIINDAWAEATASNVQRSRMN